MVITAMALLSAPTCASADLTITRDGRTDYRIVVPSDANAAVNYAASELQSFLKEISGVKIEIVAEPDAGHGPAFLLGPTKRVQNTGLLQKAKKLTGDGVLIKTVGKDIVLLGDGDRGQLYSVYVFLERFLGCRFLTYDCTVTPKQDVITLPEIDYSYSPPFIYREELYYFASNWEFASRQRLNGANMRQLGRQSWPGKDEIIPGISIYPFAHSICEIIPSKKYHKDHPEYFGLVNGERRGGYIGTQACLTNPDVIRITKEQVLEWLEEHPTIASVDVSQMDAYPGDYGACECENCAAVVKEENAQMGTMLRLVNTVADAVAEKYPGKYVDTLAYQYTIVPPKITRPRDNVIIRLCHHACYFHGIEGETLGAEYRKGVEGWTKLAKHVWVWHYGVNFWHYFAPAPNLKSLVKDFRYYQKHGVDGLMLQGDIQSPGGELCEFRQYLTSQLMWDPNQDPMAIRRDFCEGYYGPAADDVMEFLASMDTLADKLDKHIPMNGWNPPDIATPEFVAGALPILDRAFSKAKNQVQRDRIEKLMIPIWYVQLSWPDVYNTSQEYKRATWKRFKHVIEVNHITTPSEGGEIEGFIKANDERYGK